jgi:hypothetical protein
MQWLNTETLWQFGGLVGAIALVGFAIVTLIAAMYAEGKVVFAARTIIVVFFAIGIMVAQKESLVSAKSNQDVVVRLRQAHELRKLMPEQNRLTSESKSSWSGGFLFFVGGATGGSESKSREETFVRFAWKNDDGIYVISELPLTKFRVRLTQDEVPTIQYVVPARKIKTNSQDISYYVNEQNLDYVVLNIKEAYWPASIHAPLNN